MRYRTAFLTFFAFICLGLAGYFVNRNGLYPVAMVNYFNFVPAHTLELDYHSALTYFRNALATYGSDPALLSDRDTQQEIRRAALEKIIVDALVYQEAKRRFGGD